MLVYCEELLKYGVSTTEEFKKPKVSLDAVLENKGPKQKVTSGDDLH